MARGGVTVGGSARVCDHTEQRRRWTGSELFILVTLTRVEQFSSLFFPLFSLHFGSLSLVTFSISFALITTPGFDSGRLLSVRVVSESGDHEGKGIPWGGRGGGR